MVSLYRLFHRTSLSIRRRNTGLKDRTRDARYGFGWVYFFVVGAVAKLRGGVMSVSSSNTNPMRMYPPSNLLYHSNIEYTCSS